MSLATPDKIGPYQIRRRLGTGGMGEVFLAWDQRLERSVAIKRIRPDRGNSELRRRRFRREARAAARLDHSAIVQIHDFLEDATGDYIVMEHVDGLSLAELQQSSTIDVASALHYTRQAAEGLARAHDHDLIHRDLKAENLMVTAEGQVKILDFGLAKSLARQNKDSSLTHEGAVLGTLRAMSPEQALGAEVDPRTDLFSLGALLYEMLTGRSPFQASNAQQAHWKLLHEEPIPVRVLRPEVPEDIDRLVRSLLSKDPDRRPSSAREVAARLAACAALPEVRELGPPLSGRQSPSSAPTVAPPDPHSNRADRREPSEGIETASTYEARGQRGLLAVAGVLLVGLVAFWWQSSRSTRVMAPASLDEDASAYQLFREGSGAIDRYDRDGNIDRAIDLFEQALQLDSKHAPSWSGLSRAYWYRNSASPDPTWSDRALAHARHAVQLAPQLSHARISLALVQTSRGELEDARRALEELSALDPENPEVSWALAGLARKAGEPDEAIANYREAIRLAPERWHLHSGLGEQLLRTGDLAGAADAFEVSAELASDNHYPLLNLGAIYHYQGRFADAVAALQKSLEIRPMASTYSNLGTLYFFQGFYRQAAEAFESAVRLSPGRFQLWTNLGDAYRALPDRRSKADEAYLRGTQLLREQLEEHPENVDFQSLLALSLAKLESCPSALAAAARLPSRPRPAVASYRSALTKEMCGDRDGAIDALDEALTDGYSFTEVRAEPDLVHLRQDLRFHQLAVRFGDLSIP